ncbi:LysR family transcriptional regulator [Prauserella cavernicola]|uniref:LysR family transcriptional regulator n=1 Tax=Prauserella cavernicola TaxID=2800127 RepID=A0A934QZL2_9PSEU|nr:LysR family transcriptional regulator [Prauserella cavernicola]MBK1788419.1 LysR family transcriptional regulator [Prauserella cavernicola]
MNLHLAQLRAFVAVADEGGFSAAAGALGVSQSAVSHAVSALERTLGLPVLSRDRRPRPTAFGEGILVHARAALSATSAIATLATERTGGASGIVRLAAPPSVCQGLLPGLLEHWSTELPRVRVQLFEGDDDEVADWLGNGTADAAVLVDPGRDTGVLVGEDVFHAVLREDHPLAGEPAISVADLADDPLLLSAGGCESHVRRLYREARTPLRATHHVRELGTLLAMVAHGVGVSVVPGLVSALLGTGLVLVPLRERVTRRLVLTGPHHQPWQPATTALVAAAPPRR